MEESEDKRKRVMMEALQGIIDNTEELMECIGKMDWGRIETLGENISELASKLKVLSSVN